MRRVESRRTGPRHTDPRRTDLRTAALVLRSALPKGSFPIRWATRRVLHAAASGAPGVTRPLARAVRSQGAEAVWRTWLDPAVSGPAPARWSTPAVPLLLDTATPVPDAVVDAAWHDWLDAHDPALWSLLEGWARAATPTDSRTWALSRLALSPTPARTRRPGGGSGATPEEEPGKAPDETPSKPQPQDTTLFPPDLLADAALRFTHPLGERARARLLTSGGPEAVDLFCAAAVDRDVAEAVAFCVARRLAPAGEVERVVFFVRTGQHSQYRALDPDGTLLALGYRGAPPEARSALREAMTGLGGIDVLRVLAGEAAQPTVTALGEQERAYVVRQLTDRRDWAGLWRITPLLPLAEAVGTVRAFGAWRPAGEDERRLFEALRAVDPAAVRDRVDAWSAVPSSWDTPHTRIRPEELDERIEVFRTFDFAPDGTQLAFIGSGSVDGLPPGATDDIAGIVDLTGGTLSQLHTGFTYPLGYVAHLGSDTVAVAEYDPESFLATADVDHTMRIHLADHNGVRTEAGFGAGEILALARVAGDRSFVVSTGRPAGCTVLTANPDVPPAGLGGVDGVHPRATAVDPEGRLIAVFDDDDNEVVLVRLGGAEANRMPKSADGSPRSNATWQAALSPSALISCDFDGRLHVWHDPLTAVGPPATTGPRLRYGEEGLERLSAVFWSPALNRFLAVTRANLQLLDLPPTRDERHPVFASIALVGSQDAVPQARLSPRGDVLAVDDKHNAINLYALGVLTLPPFVARPLGLMTRHNLADVIAVEQNPALDEESRAVLTLLRACLEHRFRHDIGIGVPPDAPPDDAIALGETRGERGDAADAHRPLE